LYGNYALVGGGGLRGAAYLYFRDASSNNNWVLVKKLTSGDSAADDCFGESVALCGDYALVGAALKDGGGWNRGAAYIFYRNRGGPNNWGELVKLTPADTADGDQFGAAVALDGDYALVGADSKTGVSGRSGAAYIFSRNRGGPDNWGELAELTASDAAAEDFFGGAVALSGDCALVGAYNKDDSIGAAYILYRDRGGPDNWGEVKRLTAGDAQVLDYYGWSVALSGDDALIGAYYKADWRRGAAYVLNRNRGGPDNWGEAAKLTASDIEDGDWFGYSVALSGDYALVGACCEDGSGGDNRGAAYLYARNRGGPGKWGEARKITAGDAQDGDWFGSDVALYGSIGLVGAYYKWGAGFERGAAYSFEIQ
jgi:hypothetical protein